MDKTLKIYICDDNKAFADKVKFNVKMILEGKRKYTITMFDSVVELLKKFDEDFADVVFLDIDMPKMNGFEAASLLQKRKEDIFILFITSHEDMVFQSYDYHPFWFIRKGHMDDLNIAVLKLLDKIKAEEEKKYLMYDLKAENDTYKLDLNALIYIESYKNNIIINNVNSEKIKIRCKMKEAEKQLYPYSVIRIQNGILVNCRYISKITSREVILKNEERLSLSRMKVDYVKEEYQNYIRRNF